MPRVSCNNSVADPGTNPASSPLHITYGSVCSGIEAATLAWKPLGMRATWFAEIEAFPSALLAHHYSNTTNLGDMT